MKTSVKVTGIIAGTVVTLYAMTVAMVWGAAWVVDLRGSYSTGHACPPGP